MAIEDFEEMQLSAFANVTAFNWRPPTLGVSFGGGYGAGAIVAAYGLRTWSINSDLIPDLDDWKIDDMPRFTYYLDFIQRHCLYGNKPFLIKEPRTGKKYLVALPLAALQQGFDAAVITAKIFSGSLQLEERRVPDVTFNADGSIDLDYVAPSGSLTISGSAPYSGTRTLTANVIDTSALTKVEFYVDNELVGTDTTAPYTFEWDTRKHKNGVRPVFARAYDAAGNVGTLTLNVTVSNDFVKPVVSFWVPSGGSTVSGVLSVTATATDDTAIDRVEFYYFDGAGFALFAIDYASPYTVNFNTKSVDNGALILSATAFDTNGNASDAAFVSVTVNNVSEPITYGSDQLTFEGAKLIL